MDFCYGQLHFKATQIRLYLGNNTGYRWRQIANKIWTNAQSNVFIYFIGMSSQTPIFSSISLIIGETIWSPELCAAYCCPAGGNIKAVPRVSAVAGWTLPLPPLTSRGHSSWAGIISEADSVLWFINADKRAARGKHVVIHDTDVWSHPLHSFGADRELWRLHANIRKRVGLGSVGRT